MTKREQGRHEDLKNTWVNRTEEGERIWDLLQCNRPHETQWLKTTIRILMMNLPFS